MADLSIKRGLYFEDYAVGDSGASPGRTVTETDIVAFAALSGDWNAIHVDAEFARQSIAGERIAHGLLVLSIASGLAVQMGFTVETVVAFRSLEWKFTAPVKIGDTVRVRASVAELKAYPRLGTGQVTFGIEVLNQRDEITARGTWSMLVKLRPAG